MARWDPPRINLAYPARAVSQASKNDWRRRPSRAKTRAMFGLTFGEFGLVAFIVVAILTARFWPKLGEWVARRFVRKDG